ncbi:WD40/YVTN/BNR-like repeat-containing protein [Foetidibacter luteolus]|uniref:WD40/YVTN/BNR-like repeat-containing protein n=1 Tax=Foetidibacter luteolus TaxID=2608880 RepID=UPI001F2079EC|nr:YCF48-related protein [Foetidibacter luteolus]
MKRMKILLCLILSIFATICFAQRVDVLSNGSRASLRGLSPVDDDVVWVSGSNGNVGRSIDGGHTWEWKTVPGFEKRDFRDIEAFSATTAIIMAIAEPAVILKTTDGGQNWKQVFADTTKGMFLDAMDFYDNQSGVVIGDPINGKLFLAFTNDGGETWQPAPMDKRPAVDAGEACFASSGSNIHLLRGNNFLVITGGVNSRLFYNTTAFNIPVMKGGETTGGNGIAVFNRNIAIVGGDFSKKDRSDSCYVFFDQFTKAANPRFATLPKTPFSYHSGVAFISSGDIIACGLNGVDISKDNGINWKKISGESFHAVRKAKNSDAIFFTGANTKIGRLVF